MTAMALLTLRAYSGIHAGVGQEVGTVDLPIQRERATLFPVVRGSSLKGALRQAAKDAGMDETDWTHIFGPESENASDHAGALSVGDARLVLFPMRSLKGTFAWVTCPFALERLRRDLDDAGMKINNQPIFGKLHVPISSGVLVHSETQIAFEAGSQANKSNQMVVVEDFGFTVTQYPPDKHPVVPVVSGLARLGIDEKEIQARLAIVKDDHFQNFVSFCTEVVTRVHLDDETKTVKKGQLWTEELLPAESILTALLVCVDQRKKVENGAPKISGEQLLKRLQAKIPRRLQIGGNETVGYGVCHVHWLFSSNSGKN